MFLPLLLSISFALYPGPLGTNVTPPVLIAIAQCESHQHQFNPDGSVLRGKVNHKDVGEFQINEYWNGKTAKRLGFDIYTESGNIAYALYLYHTQGTAPWNASKACWGKQAPPSTGALAVAL